MDAETSLTISAWGDIVSLLLVAVNLLVGGLNPKHPVWDYSKSQKLLLFSLLFTSLVWSLFRLIQEGVHREAGPREFLTANIIYIARWLYLWVCMHLPNSKSHKLYMVATALKDVHMVRFGRCSESVESDPTRREGVPEMVIRRGVRSVPKRVRKRKASSYWRGYKSFACYHEEEGIYEVSLVQKELHSDKLDRFGTIEYLNADDAAMEEAYKHFYSIVMRAVAIRAPTDVETRNAEIMNPSAADLALMQLPNGYPPPQPIGDQLPRFEVDFSPFTRRWRGLPVNGIASGAGAVDVRMIGRVARKIAADAVYFINGEDNKDQFRTPEQIRVLNECLKNAASSVFSAGLRDGGADNNV